MNLGKRGKMNINARKLIADYCQKINLNNCENCGGNFGMAPAHKENRIYYRTVEELANPQNWIALCQKCHSKTEGNRTATEELFRALRP
jgi:5-methylcytosine-specific restriction endonuclease McrA